MIPLRNPPTTRRRPARRRRRRLRRTAPRSTRRRTPPAQVCLLQQQLGFAYAAPVAGEVTSAFGLRTHPLDGEERFHYGLDIGAEEGSVVTSFAAGTITAVGQQRRPR